MEDQQQAMYQAEQATERLALALACLNETIRELVVSALLAGDALNRMAEGEA